MLRLSECINVRIGGDLVSYVLGLGDDSGSFDELAIEGLIEADQSLNGWIKRCGDDDRTQENDGGHPFDLIAVVDVGLFVGDDGF